MRTRVFKYCKVDKYTRENLDKDQLYFNKPRNFNDPYEGIFRFDIQDINLKHKLLRSLYQHKYEELIGSKLPLDDLIEHTRIIYMNQFLNEMRLCCMSCINDSILMWSHYADQHKGICIEFDVNHDMLFKIGAEVNYSEVIPTLKFQSHDDISDDKIVEKYSTSVPTNKYIAWSYEKEYRLIRYLGEPTVNYNPKSIKAIYFGLRTRVEDIDKIKSILSNKENVKFYRSDLQKNSYRFRFLDLTKSG